VLEERIITNLSRMKVVGNKETRGEEECKQTKMEPRNGSRSPPDLSGFNQRIEYNRGYNILGTAPTWLQSGSFFGSSIRV